MSSQPRTPEEINLFDPATNDCPYHAYQMMRDEAPVWKDPTTGMYHLSLYDDIRSATLDPARFTNRIGNAAGATEKGIRPDDPSLSDELRAELELEQEIADRYTEHGWLPVPTLSGLDEPDHMIRRRLFDFAFRPNRIKNLDPFVEALAHRLVDDFIQDGRTDVVTSFAIPLPLYVIGKQMGSPEADMQQIKAWTDAWVQRLGLMQTRDERLWSVDQEIEAQHYFINKYEELRETPNDSLLSDLVNKEIPELGRALNDNELHSEMMADLFVGGSETTTNALSGGVMLAIQNPEVWARVKADPDTYLEPWCEEVIRLETPVQGLLRETAEDIEMHGVTIPAGSAVCLRYAAGNRDARRYAESAEVIDLDRKQPRTHLSFGTGIHHCLGAPLARREMYYGFKAIVERIDDMWFIDGANDFSFAPNYFLRGLKHLHIGFTPRS
jgi:cytochrome P450